MTKRSADAPSPSPSPSLSFEKDFLTKYTTILNRDQRSAYKKDFADEYARYREIHAKLDKVSKRFAQLEEKLKQEEPGSESFTVSSARCKIYYANIRVVMSFAETEGEDSSRISGEQAGSEVHGVQARISISS
jgi:hypothetical protein